MEIVFLKYVISRILDARLDPESDKLYLLIESVDGKAHYLTQNKKIYTGRLNAELVDGHIAYIEVKSFEKEENGSDKIIEYLEVKDFGSRITIKLLDLEIFSKIKNNNNFDKPINELNNDFAKEFAVKL